MALYYFGHFARKRVKRFTFVKNHCLKRLPTLNQPLNQPETNPKATATLLSSVPIECMEPCFHSMKNKTISHSLIWSSTFENWLIRYFVTFA